MAPIPVKLRRPESLVLIGGGDVMLHTARTARARGFRVIVVLAPRHAEEILPIGGRVTREAFADLGVALQVVDDINAWPELERQDWIGQGALALCFGPAWIFGRACLAAFGVGMINYNPIPVPRYLGGAHYTWQILNGDREGGCILQLITEQLDRGPILRAKYFIIPDAARTPADYFEAYNATGNELLEELLDELVNGCSFDAAPYADVNPRRLYLPRLFTLHNGLIDWQWSGVEIERFCCAFDTPYAGAGTFVDDIEVRLSGVWLEPSEDLHPFLSGLVVRRISDQAWVAARGGLLRIDSVRTSSGEDGKGLLREGRRLATPPERLHQALTYRPKLSGKGIN